MSYPNIPEKYKYKSLFTAGDYNAYLRKNGFLPEFEIPEGVVFCYSRTLLKGILGTVEHSDPMNIFAGDFYLLNFKGKTIGLSGGFGAGAPVVTTILEELVDLGVKNFVSIGQAGSLQKNLPIGSFVVCNKAIRDEGVSHHYEAPDKYSAASQTLTERLKSEFTSLGVSFTEGVTWTTDAPYRETIEEIKQYQSEGVLTVEMEAAALFSVANYLGVNLATAFCISDSLADVEWNPQLRSPDSLGSLLKLSEAALNTLL